MKKLIAVCLVLASLNAYSSVLDDLKKRPVSQYEFGVMKIELLMFFVQQKMDGRSIPHTKFDFYKAGVSKDNGGIQVKFAYIGKAKYLTQKNCQPLVNGSKHIFNKDETIKEIWPSLSEQDYTELLKHVTVSVELVSKDNHNLTIKCS